MPRNKNCKSHVPPRDSNSQPHDCETDALSVNRKAIRKTALKELYVGKLQHKFVVTNNKRLFKRRKNRARLTQHHNIR
jgi:hypothetical protein